MSPAPLAGGLSPSRSSSTWIRTGRWPGSQVRSFNNPKQLGDILAKTPQCQECVVKQVFRYMAGRQDTPADRPLLTQALAAFRKSEYNFKELMVALVKLREFPEPRRLGNVASNH